jgi:hypothetical protein
MEVLERPPIVKMTLADPDAIRPMPVQLTGVVSKPKGIGSRQFLLKRKVCYQKKTRRMEVMRDCPFVWSKMFCSLPPMANWTLAYRHAILPTPFDLIPGLGTIASPKWMRPIRLQGNRRLVASKKNYLCQLSPKQPSVCPKRTPPMHLHQHRAFANPMNMSPHAHLVGLELCYPMRIRSMPSLVH